MRITDRFNSKKLILYYNINTKLVLYLNHFEYSFFVSLMDMGGKPRQQRRRKDYDVSDTKKEYSR